MRSISFLFFRCHVVPRQPLLCSNDSNTTFTAPKKERGYGQLLAVKSYRWKYSRYLGCCFKPSHYRVCRQINDEGWEGAGRNLKGS